MTIASAIWKLKDAINSLEKLEGKCLNCGQPESKCGELYKCWDCKTSYCDACVRDHFGNGHQPHPWTRTQIRCALKGMVAALKKRTVDITTNRENTTDEEAIAMYHAAEALKRVPPEKGDPDYD